MSKQTIHITESQLQQIIAESVTRTLNEGKLGRALGTAALGGLMALGGGNNYNQANAQAPQTSVVSQQSRVLANQVIYQSPKGIVVRAQYASDGLHFSITSVDITATPCIPFSGVKHQTLENMSWQTILSLFEHASHMRDNESYTINDITIRRIPKRNLMPVCFQIKSSYGEKPIIMSTFDIEKCLPEIKQTAASMLKTPYQTQQFKEVYRNEMKSDLDICYNLLRKYYSGLIKVGDKVKIRKQLNNIRRDFYNKYHEDFNEQWQNYLKQYHPENLQNNKQ